MSETVYSVNLLVQTNPEDFSQVCYELGKLPDTHFAYLERSQGKIVVIQESTSIESIYDWMDIAGTVASVCSVSIISQHTERLASPAPA